MARFSLLFVLLGLMALTSNAQLEFEHNGLTRTYYMDAPDPIPAGAPLVVVLHGYTSSAILIRAYSNWDELALSEGFVAVFPQGTENNFGINHWNANFGGSDTDDHNFLVALVQHLQAEYDLSPDCTYSCGMSNGGFMSYSLACEHPDVFSAIGSVTGSMTPADMGCTPEEVVSIIHLHGTEDSTVPYEGSNWDFWGLPSVPSIVNHWTELMGTTTMEQTALPNQEIVDVTSVDLLRYAGAPGGQEFHHYRVNGGGHEWFGVWGSPDVDATAVLWDFFSAQCAGMFTDVPVLEDTAKWVAVTADGIRSRQPCTVEAFNVLGQRSASFQLDAGESWRPENAGMTVLRITGEDGRVQTVKWTR